MVVGYAMKEEVHIMDDSQLTADLRLTGGDSTSWDTSVPIVCERFHRRYMRFHCRYMRFHCRYAYIHI